MLYRLGRPMRRKGFSNHYFTQRIPSDVKARAVGPKLEVPVADRLVPVTVSAKMDAIRISLRTSRAGEVKARQAQIAAYLESVWEALRNDAPVPLSHRQAVALSGDLYRAWADDQKTRSTAVVQSAPGGWDIDPETVGDAPELWEAAIAALPAEETEELEPALGPLIDRLLLRKGIHAVEAASRSMLLRAFRQAILEGLETRRRNAAGDYSTDPAASRFPQWEAPAGRKATPGIPLTELVEDWWTECLTSDSLIGAGKRKSPCRYRVAEADLVPISTSDCADLSAMRTLVTYVQALDLSALVHKAIRRT